MALTNNEGDFRRKILKSAYANKKWLVLNLPDEMKKAIRLLPQHADILAKCIEEKPFDLGLLYSGKFCALELKNVKDSLAFNINRIEKHQIYNLKQAVKCGGLGYVLCRFLKGLTIGDRKRLNITGPIYNIDLCVAMDIRWICKQKDKSLPIELLREQCFQLPYEPISETYDLSPLWVTPKKESKSK